MRSRSGQGGTIRPHTAQAGVSASLPPDDWRHIDASEAGARATEYLDAAAAAIAAARHRSHQLLDVDPGASVLDVGCGTGIALREIADLVGTDGTIVGLDPSTAMLEQTRARLAGVSARIHLIEGTATDTGLERDRFDAVRTERVLMHISQPREALAELARVTRPGGRIVVVEPDHRRLAVDTDVPDTWLGLVNAFSRLVPNISAGLRVLSDATALGLTVVAIEPMTHQFRSYRRFVEVYDLEIGRDAARQEGMADGDLDVLLDDLVIRDREGRFLAVGTMYVVAMEKRR
jgi:ubiquinone/menaquinone biosynthesis C-methylase UbiE